jgi:hypothetical protein
VATNEGEVYFKLVGDFEPDVVTKEIGIEPSREWVKSSLDLFRCLYNSNSRLWKYRFVSSINKISDIQTMMSQRQI